MTDRLLPGERIDQLNSGGIEIIQNQSVFAFSLDAVLLAAFAQVPPTGRIVDLGAGNGAVGLFVARRTQARIDLVEIQPLLADMARRSAALNGLADQITVHTMPMQQAPGVIAKDSVDTVLTNPPYFKNVPTSKRNPNPHLAMARHEVAVSLAEVAAVSAALLKFGGKLFMVHRPERLDEILPALTAHGLAPKRVRFIFPKPNKEANMVLIEAIRGGKPNGVRIVPSLIVHDTAGNYTPEVANALRND